MRDRIIWHSIHMDRYKVGVQKELWSQLDSARKSVRKRLERLTKQIEAGGSSAVFTQARLTQELADLNKMLDKSYARMAKNLHNSNIALAEAEIEWVSGELGKRVGATATLATPTAAQVVAAVQERPFEGWATSKKGAATYVKNSPLRAVPEEHLKAMGRVVKDGFITGAATSEIEKQIAAVNKMTKAVDASFDVARRNVAAEARTSLQVHASRAAETVYEANKDIFPYVEFTATLDGETTETCASLDGSIYAVDDYSRPAIPQHWNCRSTYVPVENKKGVDSPRPARVVTKKYEKGDTRKTRGAFKSKQVKSGTKFNDWLAQQDKVNPSFVRDYFKSDKRYEDWKKGKLGKIRYTTTDGRTVDAKGLKKPQIRKKG